MQVGSTTSANSIYQQSTSNKNDSVSNDTKSSNTLDWLPEKYQNMVNKAMDDAGITDEVERFLMEGTMYLNAAISKYHSMSEVIANEGNLYVEPGKYATKSSFMELVDFMEHNANLSKGTLPMDISHDKFVHNLYEAIHKEKNEIDLKA